MGGIKIDNVVSSSVISWLRKSFQQANRRRNPKVNDIEEVRAELKKLVEKERGVVDNGDCHDSPFIRKLIDAEDYGDAIDYYFHNKLIEGLDLEQIKSYLDLLVKQLNDRSTNQSSGPNINIQPGNVRRCLLFLRYFPEHFVFNLERVTRLSVPNEVIPEKLKKLPDFLDIIGEDSDHFLLKDKGRIEIKNSPEWDNLSIKPCLEGIENEPNKDSYPPLIFEVGRNTKPSDFEQKEFMLLRYLSLRKVNLTNGENLNLNKLSSLKYLDLKHTKVKDCSWFECLEKLQMLDLRYTYVKKIPDNILEKLGKLQHLLLGYIKGGGNQLAGAKLNVQKLNKINLKTLRAIEPEKIEEISNVNKVVDLSVTGLTTASLPTFWSTLENFENLTSLGVAVTDESVINCKAKLKKNLKRLQMEGFHSGLEKLGGFGELNDLTLANMDIKKIPGLPKLLCLRLYGVCQKETCEIDLNGCRNLKKLVIGDMGEVGRVQICSAVFHTVATLKFSNLEWLKEVAYTDKQDSDEHHSLLRWANSKAQECSGEVKPNKTIFLRNSGDFRVENSPDLKIYQYNMEMQCYKLLN